MPQSNLGLDSIISKSWLLFRASLKNTYWYAFLGALLTQLFWVWLSRSNSVSFQSADGSVTVNSPGLVVGLSVAFLVVTILVDASIMLQQYHKLHGEQPGLKAIWQGLKPAFWRVFFCGDYR